MRYFPPDELRTILKKNYAFTVANNVNDNVDLAMMQFGTSIDGGDSLGAFAGGTTSITAAALDVDTPRTWDEWVSQYDNYELEATTYTLEIQTQSSDTTGNVWIVYWVTGSESRNIPALGIDLSAGLFDNNNTNFTGTEQISSIIMNARHMRKVRTYRADALGGRRVIKVRLSAYRGPNGEVAMTMTDNSAITFGGHETVHPTSQETIANGVQPLLHVALINQDRSTAHIAADIFVQVAYQIHFFDRKPQANLQSAA